MEDVSPPQHLSEKYGPKFVDKTEKPHDRATALKAAADVPAMPVQPAGGFDSTPIPDAPPGYTLRFTFHRAINLPFADFGTFSSDPYVKAQLIVDVPRRHKQDPDITFRTPTIRRNTNPEWNNQWIVANVPASGFELKCRIYDEDPADHDDRLGNAYVRVESIHDEWEGIKEQSFRVKKRMGSKRAYFVRGIAAAIWHERKLDAQLVVSVDCLGKTPGDVGGQIYTVGPNYWFKHFSPLIGRLAGTKDSVQSRDGKRSITRYNFQAVQMQLKGPVPSQLYHRYVEFKPFVAGMFTSHSLQGRILNRALHHQHARIYNFDRTTQYGEFSSPCIEFTQKFLEFVHYDQGGRIFTYVLTLDGQLRFTETGKEFGIDLLSKHTMHSDVSIYIAYSGEFFVRRRKHRHRRLSRGSDVLPSAPEPAEENPLEPSTDPAAYELFIDNDSGTYRPNADYLPVLKEFISANLPGLHVSTLDCQKDAERMQRLKEEQRERKKKEGQHMTYMLQSNSSSSSLSSSDVEELDERSGEPSKQRGHFAQKLHEMKDVKGRLMDWAAEADGEGLAPRNWPGQNGASTTRDAEPARELPADSEDVVARNNNNNGQAA
ncbi:hypothetical protein VTN00DRAFT_5922 [Thermoascus crustaceus]|uniref:uncharacterized protein n=1 Tax=Thermoascus crustaceus TaxID=5088 RepID=UPI0037420D23